MLSKGLITNLSATAVIVAGYSSPYYPEQLKSIGFFALSGAVTNWLAVHMLFEKVPLLYGSGIIPNRFEDFKASIKNLMMRQFFTVENIEQFIEREEQEGARVLDIGPILNAVDYDRIYDGLVTSIMESYFGGLIQKMGGEDALITLKEPFTQKMKKYLVDMVESDRFKSALHSSLNAHRIGEDITERIEVVIDKRLDELTPQMVKEIVQDIIHEHLGWLVVWGGVFGGLMGGVFSYA